MAAFCHGSTLLDSHSRWYACMDFIGVNGSTYVFDTGSIDPKYSVSQYYLLSIAGRNTVQGRHTRTTVIEVVGQ